MSFGMLGLSAVICWWPPTRRRAGPPPVAQSTQRIGEQSPRDGRLCGGALTSLMKTADRRSWGGSTLAMAPIKSLQRLEPRAAGPDCDSIERPAGAGDGEAGGAKPIVSESYYFYPSWFKMVVSRYVCKTKNRICCYEIKHHSVASCPSAQLPTDCQGMPRC